MANHRAPPPASTIKEYTDQALVDLALRSLPKRPDEAALIVRQPRGGKPRSVILRCVFLDESDGDDTRVRLRSPAPRKKKVARKIGRAA